MAARRARGGRVRIIGGDWRGRKLPVPDAPGLRPTGDRVRETLFNWLQYQVPGGRVLDLFAGSGALGFEAASRGAREVVMLERDARVASQLRENAATLGAGAVRVEHGDALQWLESQKTAFDVVFVDPPFDAGLLTQVIESVRDNGIIGPAGRLYFEFDVKQEPPAVGQGWRELKRKQAGQVGFGLLEPVASTG